MPGMSPLSPRSPSPSPPPAPPPSPVDNVKIPLLSVNSAGGGSETDNEVIVKQPGRGDSYAVRQSNNEGKTHGKNGGSSCCEWVNDHCSIRGMLKCSCCFIAATTFGVAGAAAVAAIFPSRDSSGSSGSAFALLGNSDNTSTPFNSTSTPFNSTSTPFNSTSTPLNSTSSAPPEDYCDRFEDFISLRAELPTMALCENGCEVKEDDGTITYIRASKPELRNVDRGGTMDDHPLRQYLIAGTTEQYVKIPGNRHPVKSDVFSGVLRDNTPDKNNYTSTVVKTINELPRGSKGYAKVQLRKQLEELEKVDNPINCQNVSTEILRKLNEEQKKKV